MVQFLDDYYISDDLTIRRAQIVEVVLSHCAHALWAKKPEKLRMAAAWASHIKNVIRKQKDAVKTAMTPHSSTTSRHSEQQMECNSCDSEGGGSVVPLAKNGTSGLSVVSVDALQCKAPPRHRNERKGDRVDKQARGDEKRGGEMVNGGGPAIGNSAPCSSTAPCQNGSGAVNGRASERRGCKEFPTSSTSVPAASCGGCGGGGGEVAAAHEKNPLTSSSPNQLQPPPFELQKEDWGDGNNSPTLDSDGFIVQEDVAAMMPDGDVVFVSSTGSPFKDVEHHLSDLHAVPLHVKRLSGGITNELFHVYDEEDPSSSVVVRVYGKETERVISRESELFYQSIFLETYVHGQNFLIYQFLAQHETLPYTDMPKEALPIARAVANFQVRATLVARHDRAAPLIAEERAPPALCKDGQLTPRFDRESNYTVHALTTWVEQITSQEILDKVHPDKRENFTSVANKLRAESVVMLRILETERANLGESVCHNDLLSGNFMRHEKTGELKIIDFDYTKRDFFLFDAANHFNEYTGLECDYAQYFPSDAHMAKFVADYRHAMRREVATAHYAAANPEEEIIPNEWELFWGAGVATTTKGVYVAEVHADKEAAIVAHWTALVKFLTLCSHLSWSIWSLVQEAVSQLDVDFLEYAKLRLSRYFETKEAYTTGLGFSAV